MSVYYYQFHIAKMFFLHAVNQCEINEPIVVSWITLLGTIKVYWLDL